jgi:hypothetical protein
LHDKTEQLSCGELEIRRFLEQRRQSRFKRRHACDVVQVDGMRRGRADERKGTESACAGDHDGNDRKGRDGRQSHINGGRASGARNGSGVAVGGPRVRYGHRSNLMGVSVSPSRAA